MGYAKTNLEESATFQLKKKLLIITFITRNLISGIEYTVLFPSVLLYAQSLHAGTFLSGVVVAAYPAAALFSLPIFGYLYDKTKRLKALLLLLNSFQIIGNIIYTVSFSIWFPILGRLIAGFGDGFSGIMIAEVSYLYPKNERLGILSVIEIGHVVGTVIGPSFNFLVSNKKYVIYTWILDNKTLPGVLMAFLWSLMAMVIIFCTFSLAKELIEISKDEASYAPLANEEETVPSSEKDAEVNDVVSLNKKDKLDYNASLSYQNGFAGNKDDERTTDEISAKKSLLAASRDSKLDPEKEKQTNLNSCKDLIVQLISFEFIILVLIDLVLWFSQIIFELLLPYVTEFDYHWSPQSTGLIYVFTGIEISLVFAVLYFTGIKCPIKEVYLILASLIFTQISLGLQIYENSLVVMTQRYIVFGITVMFVLGSIPLNAVCIKTLLTKLFRPEQQGIVQGISSAISSLAMISGPIIAGYVFYDRTTYGIILSIICFLAIVLLFGSLRKINEKEIALQDKMKTEKE